MFNALSLYWYFMLIVTSFHDVIVEKICKKWILDHHIQLYYVKNTFYLIKLTTTAPKATQRQ